jgi:hypothetical protein
MSLKSTWLWILVAGGLFGFIFFLHRHAKKAVPPHSEVLPNITIEAVTSVHVRPLGPVKLEIRADHTNNSWQLTEPIVYPAQAVSVEKLLSSLVTTAPATYITPAEVRSRPKADEEYGLTSPQASIIILQGNYRVHLLIGAKTNPGDQFFLQRVGDEGVYVMDAELLKYIPSSANDWRDTTLLNMDGLVFDTIAVTNNAKSFVLQLGPNRLWRIGWPLIDARADNGRIEEALQKLQALHVLQFASDDSKADLEPFGLARAELEITLARGTNTLAALQFGRSPTNEPGQVYARRGGQNSIFTVSKDLCAPWLASLNDFRARHLVSLSDSLEGVEVRGQDVSPFYLRHETNQTWRVMPDNFPGDSWLIKEMLATLGSMPIIEFVKDVVNPPEWPEYGLAVPAREYILSGPCTDSTGTNSLVATLDFGFGTNQHDKVFARRTDESSVYSVSTNEFARLPRAGWQLRERKLWNFTINDVARAVIRQPGRTRQLLRNGPHQWSLAPGSQGIINDLAVEETVRGLIQVSAQSWVGTGEQLRRQYGLAENAPQIVLELKNGEKVAVEFGAEAPSTNVYAAVNLEGQLWLFEFPWVLYRDVASYLLAP